MADDKYRLLVAAQYLNASNALFGGLKSQQAKNDFYFLVTLRSFLEYTVRGVWFLAWATEEQVQAVKTLTFDRPGSPGLATMDAMINEALGLGRFSSLNNPVPDIENDSLLNGLHALTHGNPISVRMLAFGVDKIFQTEMLLLKAQTNLDVFRILVYRRILGEELSDIWRMLSTIHNQPPVLRTNVLIAAKQVKDAGLTSEILKEPDEMPDGIGK